MVDRPADRADVLRLFEGLAPTARELLALGETWRQWVLCDRDPVDDWADGRVVLLGDAAHAMLQYAAQGACMALEDAVVLGDLVDCSSDEYPQMFAKYNALRRARTARVQAVSRDMGRLLYHPAGAEARARNAMLAAHTEESLHRAVTWLHGDRTFTQDR